MIVSATCCAAAGFLFHAPAPLLYLFAMVWDVAVIADSAQLSALVAHYTPRDHVGTALTIQTSLGFLLTMASIRLLPISAQAVGWQSVLVCLMPGPIFGVHALRGLQRLDEVLVQQPRVGADDRVEVGARHDRPRRRHLQHPEHGGRLGILLGLAD